MLSQKTLICNFHWIKRQNKKPFIFASAILKQAKTNGFMFNKLERNKKIKDKLKSILYHPNSLFVFSHINIYCQHKLSTACFQNCLI